MTDTYYSLFVALAICAGLFFIGAGAMFFMFDIPKIIGHLTGYTARKQIKQIQNRTSPVVNYSDHLNTFMNEQRNIADNIKNNSRQETVSNTAPPAAPKQNNAAQTDTMQETATLALETEPLVKNAPAGRVKKITPAMPETSILEPITDKLEIQNDDFKVIFSIEYINTNESI